MFLEKAPAISDVQSEQRKTGWSRPIYVFRRGFNIICGYLERDGAKYALLSSVRGHGSKTTLAKDELKDLWRASCVLIPV
jgi:hypothetical protein